MTGFSCYGTATTNDLLTIADWLPTPSLARTEKVYDPFDTFQKSAYVAADQDDQLDPSNEYEYSMASGAGASLSALVIGFTSPTFG